MWTLAIVLALCGVAHADLENSRTNFLRQQRGGPLQEQQMHRKLAAFVIPYRLLWRIEIGNNYDEDRQPTAAEYEGVRNATEYWFDSANAEHYAGANFTYIDTECDLILVNETTWDAGADHPHQIQLECNANFDAEQLDDLPNNVDFISTINTEYNFKNFTHNYLWEASPADNIFRYSQGVGYNMTDNGPAAPAGGTAAPTRPVSPQLGPDPRFSKLYALPFAIVWEMAVYEGGVDRQPTEEDYDGMRAATREWFIAQISAIYAGQSDKFTLNSFGLQNDPEPTYTAGIGIEHPHKIRQNAYPIFNANSLSDLPTVGMLLQNANTQFDITSYIVDYLRWADPASSVFRDTGLVKFTSSTAQPAGPVNMPDSSTTTTSRAFLNSFP